MTQAYLQSLLLPNPQTITVATQKVVFAVIARNNGEAGVLNNVVVSNVFDNPDIIIHRTSATDSALGVANGSTSALGTGFDTSTKIWTIGSLGVGLSNAKVLFIETSLPSGTNLATALPITLTSTISVAGITDSVSGNNVQVQVLYAPTVDLSCAPVAVGQNGECLCSVATNDMLCSHGITKFEIIPGTYVNVDPDRLRFNINTGEYSKSALLNPTLDGTFQYFIKCYDENGVLIGGSSIPTTETIRALFLIEDLDLGLVSDPDTETLNLMQGDTVLDSVDWCDIVDTCSDLDENDLAD